MRAAKVQASLRIRAVSPEPPLLAHTSSESRGTFRQKARSLAPLNGWACAVKFVMTECSKTQIRLTGLMLWRLLNCLPACQGYDFKHQSLIGCDPDATWSRPILLQMSDWLAIVETVVPIAGMSLWSPINLRQVLQLVSDWSETYRQLLTLSTAIGLRSVETGRWMIGDWFHLSGDWSVTDCRSILNQNKSI